MKAKEKKLYRGWKKAVEATQVLKQNKLVD